MGLAPKWPMSAYSASAPVMASVIAPNAMKATIFWRSAKATAWCGDSAARTSGRCTIWCAPSTASRMNQISVTGPNHLPMPLVPKCWTENRATMTPIAIGMTMGWKAGVATVRPSTALRTEMAGVSRQSP